VTLSLFSLINTPSPGGERGGDDKRETKNRGKREEIEQNQKKKKQNKTKQNKIEENRERKKKGKGREET
jgi:hypothetical protein